VAVSLGAACLAPAPLRAQPAPPQTARELILTAGKSLIVNSAANIERVAVGFGDVAEARAVGPKEVLLDAKAPGETSLIVWQEGGNKLFFDVIVRANTSAIRAKLDNVRKQIADELPGQEINISMQNDTIFLGGTARDLVSAERAAAIASTAGKVANLMYVEVPTSETQVLLKVQFATVDRNAAQELGANIVSTGATNTVGRVTTGQFSAPSPTTISGTGGTNTFTISDALNIFLYRKDINLGATIRALQSRNLAEVLAEPNVLAINGKPASFVAGGEFPYPILQGGQAGIGTITVAFREFGVRINFLPIVTSRGTIRLDVAPEVSSLDYAAGLTVQGFTVPGLATRRVETEIELESGQSFAIAGLLDRRLTETMQKIPLLADIPILGTLFKSRSLTRQNNELLVVVTPEIVKPVQAGQIKQLEYPKPLSADGKTPQAPQTPGMGAQPAAPRERVPYEQLMQQMKKENEMKLQQGAGGGSNWPGSQPIPIMGTAPAGK
jgi:pilus assembly protein CpaC